MQFFRGALFEGSFEDFFLLERPCWSATSVKLHGAFVGVNLRRGCSPVDSVVLFGARFKDSISGGLLPHTEYLLYISISILFNSVHFQGLMTRLLVFYRSYSLLVLQYEFILLCIYKHTHMHILYIHICMHMHACMYVCVSVCIYIYIYIYIYFMQRSFFDKSSILFPKHYKYCYRSIWLS